MSDFLLPLIHVVHGQDIGTQHIQFLQTLFLKSLKERQETASGMARRQWHAWQDSGRRREPAAKGLVKESDLICLFSSTV